MKTILNMLLILLVAGWEVLAAEDFGEETTTTNGFTDLDQDVNTDSQPSPGVPDPTMKPSILRTLEKVAWKILELDWNVTSAIQRKLNGPLIKGIRMRAEAEPALARIIGLVEGGILSNNFQKKK